MGNCFGVNKAIDIMKQEHINEINYLKSVQYSENEKLLGKIEYQDERIKVLTNKVTELELRADQLLLDYYNLEQNYFKTKNELVKCKGNLGMFQKIFSL